MTALPAGLSLHSMTLFPSAHQPVRLQIHRVVLDKGVRRPSEHPQCLRSNHVHTRNCLLDTFTTCVNDLTSIPLPHTRTPHVLFWRCRTGTCGETAAASTKSAA